jgi:hypothetical protein
VNTNEFTHRIKRKYSVHETAMLVMLKRKIMLSFDGNFKAYKRVVARMKME